MTFFQHRRLGWTANRRPWWILSHYAQWHWGHQVRMTISGWENAALIRPPRHCFASLFQYWWSLTAFPQPPRHLPLDILHQIPHYARPQLQLLVSMQIHLVWGIEKRSGSEAGWEGSVKGSKRRFSVTRITYFYCAVWCRYRSTYGTDKQYRQKGSISRDCFRELGCERIDGETSQNGSKDNLQSREYKVGSFDCHIRARQPRSQQWRHHHSCHCRNSGHENRQGNIRTSYHRD